MNIFQLSNDSLRIIASFIQKVRRGSRCTCYSPMNNVLPFMYTCKRIYFLLIQYESLWNNIFVVRKFSILENDPRRTFIKTIKCPNGTTINTNGFTSCRNIITKFLDINPKPSKEFLSQLEYHCTNAGHYHSSLAYIRKMINLRKLDICKLDVISTIVFTNCTKLNILRLCDCIHLCDDFANFKNLTNLTRLIMPHFCMKKGIMKYLPKLKYIIVSIDTKLKKFYDHPTLEHITFNRYMISRGNDIISHTADKPYKSELGIKEILVYIEYEDDIEEIQKRLLVVRTIRVDYLMWISKL
jgi:hypothetical protein